MNSYKESYTLTERFGPDIILADDADNEEHYRVLTEIEVDQQHYAILQLHGDPDEEAYLFRVFQEGDQIAVEDVEDDDEWERVAEVCRQLIHEQ